jgi:hypothetical protein
MAAQLSAKPFGGLLLLSMGGHTIKEKISCHHVSNDFSDVLS